MAQRIAFVVASALMILSGCAIAPQYEPVVAPPPPPSPMEYEPPPSLPANYGGYDHSDYSEVGHIVRRRVRARHVAVAAGQPTGPRPGIRPERSYATAALRFDAATESCMIGDQQLDDLGAEQCEQLQRQLGPGCMGFRDREMMFFNKPKQVKVALKRGPDCGGIREAVDRGEDSAHVSLVGVTTTRVMYADLEGPEFKIERIGDRKRDTRVDARPVWAWQVTPKVRPKGASQEFTLTAKLGIEVVYPDGRKVPLALDIQDQVVRVDVTTADVRDEWGDWLKGWILWPVGILGAIAALTASIKKTRDSVLGLFRKG